MAMQHESSTAPLRPAEPAAGFDVFTADGMPVGTVSEIAGGFMRIDAQLRPDFWLRLDEATNVEGRSVTLAYPKEALPQHKHTGPAPTPDDYMPAGADPVLLDEEEQQHQRELMERELEEQRRLREQRASAEAEWHEEQESGAKITGIVIAVVAMGGVLLGLLAWRRRRRRAADMQPTL